jgi:hydrogenase maturation protease
VSEQRLRILLLGYGNPGRCDDGLGPAVAEAIASMAIPGVTVDAGYQLQVEDAALVAEHDVVVFADASVNAADPFELHALEPSDEISFTSHSISPEALLSMAREYFGGSTRGYALAIRGHEFNEFGERLSSEARRNLDAAVSFVAQVLREQRFEQTPPRVSHTGFHCVSVL